MSLLDQYKEEFKIMNGVLTPDGEGGYVTEWSEGNSIELALRHDSSIQARKAEHDGVTSTFTLLAPKGSGLEFHDILKRVSDGIYYRITSHADESYTPSTSSLNLTTMTAERWTLK